MKSFLQLVSQRLLRDKLQEKLPRATWPKDISRLFLFLLAISAPSWVSQGPVHLLLSLAVDRDNHLSQTRVLLLVINLGLRSTKVVCTLVTIERFSMTFTANGKRQIHVYVFSK